MKKTAAAIITAALLAGCHGMSRQSAMEEPLQATAALQPTKDSKAFGEATFEQIGDKLHVIVNAQGLTPNQEHGFHIHEKGDCGNNAINAGGHFNPTGMIHGAPDAVSHHAGDFGNVTAEATGEVHTRFTTHSISLKPNDAMNAVGHAVVLHGNPDDLTSQPAGNAGPRIACGIVQIMSGM